MKVGEYNAIADVLDLINNSIRFQGMKKARCVCVWEHWLGDVKLTEEEKKCSDESDVCLYIC